MASESAARESSISEKWTPGMRRFAGSERTGVHACPIVTAV